MNKKYFIILCYFVAPWQPAQLSGIVRNITFPHFVCTADKGLHLEASYHNWRFPFFVRNPK